MKQFLSFIRKEFYHIFRDTRTMLILLVMPIVLIILFGYAITTEIKCVSIAVFDQSRDEVTGKIIEHLSLRPMPPRSSLLPGRRYKDSYRRGIQNSGRQVSPRWFTSCITRL